ncbi:DNA-directed RNA polymerase subunit delta [Geomicrobium sp. JCM 19039]|uniref:DNA-directed RNA polymerase subunit delta n=1 Tax=Geomicrobium sp. JCM 19039 TaxID=1460636 RepID=UPI00045F22A9|nr:DNA-directed RNA polymerase subunit delta [Geomicrobium sp. JCM 19039]GAK12127.1 DNA-directed RNA polymerase delta subunit [Geomicrobium sp. JCM 19039]
MTIKELSREEITEMSAVEITYRLIKEKNGPAEFANFFTQVSELKQIPSKDLDDRRTKLFTTLNIDGRFVHLGNNHWGLKEWYPVDKTDEDLGNTFQAPEPEESQEFEDIEDELDEIANEDDTDADEQSDDDLDGYDDNDESGDYDEEDDAEDDDEEDDSNN